MTRHIDQHSDDAHTNTVIARLYELARDGAADGAELRHLDAEIMAGLTAAYGESGSPINHPMSA